MALNPQPTFSMTQLDQSGEKTNIRLNTLGVLALDPVAPLAIALQNAFDTELTDGLWTAYGANGVLRLNNAAVGGGNREDKVLLVYEDNATKKLYTSELGCRISGLTTIGSGSDSVPPASWAATKTAWDALVSSVDGNPTTLIDVRIIGRNI